MDLNLNSSKIVFLFLFQEEKREFIFHEYFQSETQKKCFNHLNVELGNFLRVWINKGNEEWLFDESGKLTTSLLHHTRSI